jgi:hypothetical protein
MKLRIENLSNSFLNIVFYLLRDGLRFFKKKLDPQMWYCETQCDKTCYIIGWPSI